MSALKKWHSFVASFGCVVCLNDASVHHPRGGSVTGEAGAGMKSPESGVIPLCHLHHQGREGIHQIGVETWEQRYGTQVEHRKAVARSIKAWEKRTGRTAPQPPSEVEDALPRLLPRWGSA